MLDYESARNMSVSYWQAQPTDRPWLLNGFSGTWQFSDHTLIPEPIVNFLIDYFWDELPESRKSHYKALSLDKINSCLNEIWEGPGSMVKLVNLQYDLRNARLNEKPGGAKDVLKGYNTPTIESELELDEDEE